MGDQTDTGVPGYFVGKPANYADQQPKAAAEEPKPANTQIPGDYFVGAPKNRQQQQQQQKLQTLTIPTDSIQPTGEVKRSRSFLTKWLSCLDGGAAAS